jgi:hypothetical protein
MKPYQPAEIEIIVICEDGMNCEDDIITVSNPAETGEMP